jgi:hypothetical protein
VVETDRSHSSSASRGANATEVRPRSIALQLRTQRTRCNQGLARCPLEDIMGYMVHTSSL